jgi:hypothetical protein
MENSVKQISFYSLNDAILEFRPLKQDQILDLIEAYRNWRDLDEYLLLLGRNRFTYELKHLGVRASKRGNDVYSYKLSKRLGFFNQLKGHLFFNHDSFKSGDPVYSNLLWVTLTYHSKRSNLNEAWLNCETEFNRWITNLRNRYGKIDVLKFKQAFPDPQGEAYGYPHFHVVLFFRDHKFKVFQQILEDDDGKLKLVYRIKEKNQLHTQGKWHSFIDVKAINSLSSVVNYCGNMLEL